MNAISEDGIKDLLEAMDCADLPELLQTLAGSIGLANVLTLCRMFGGTSLYVPKLDSVALPAKKRLVRKRFTGNNHRELAKQFALSERAVYDIVMEDRARKSQLNLFNSAENP